MDIETLKVMATSTVTSPSATVQKDSYVLSPHSVDARVAVELACALSLDQQIKECTTLLGESLKRIRDYGQAQVEHCRAMLGGNLLSVKLPYRDAQNSERMATVTCSRRYSVNKKGVLAAEADLGQARDLFEIERRHVLTDKGLDVLRGLLARSGLSGKQIENAIDQMCEVVSDVRAVEDFDERVSGVPVDKADLARSFVTRAAASVKL
jgi:hypothetical protein